VKAVWYERLVPPPKSCSTGICRIPSRNRARCGCAWPRRASTRAMPRRVRGSRSGRRRFRASCHTATGQASSTKSGRGFRRAGSASASGSTTRNGAPVRHRGRAGRTSRRAWPSRYRRRRVRRGRLSRHPGDDRASLRARWWPCRRQDGARHRRRGCGGSLRDPARQVVRGDGDHHRQLRAEGRARSKARAPTL